METNEPTFTGEGFKPFPNVYYDLMRTGDYAMENPDGSYIYTTERLEAVILEYAQFLRREDIMPRATTSANEIIERTLFELAWRDGVYAEYTVHDEDELCGGDVA
jgi:hypothetical protein